MAVYIDAINFSNEFASADTDWLLGNVGERIVVTIDVSVREVAIPPDADSEFEFFPATGYLTPAQIIKAQTGVFKNFQVGDIIDIASTTSNNVSGAIITEKISDSEIRTDQTFVNELSSTATVTYATPVTGFNFFYGLIENSEAFNTLSKIANVNQKYYVGGIDATDVVTVTTMSAEGSKAWQNGSVTIKGLGTDAYNQKFRIVHTFDILPFYLETELADLQAGIKPTYFKDLKCLKYVNLFEALEDITNPNQKQSGQFEETLGNTGWFNENFNNVPDVYSVTSIAYENALAEPLDAVENTLAETTVTIVLASSTASFSNNNTKFLVQFSILPLETEYQVSTRNIKENFMFDRKLQTVGSASANGDNYGSGQQVLKSVVGTFNSTSQITITFKVAFLSAGLTYINTLTNANYLIAVAVQNHSLATAVADKTNLLCDVNELFLDVTDDGLITFTGDLIEHNDDLLVGVSSLEAFPGDEIIVRQIIKLDLAGRDASLIYFDTLNVAIIADNGTDEFDLEAYQYDFSNDVRIDNITQVNVSQQREFVLADTDNRKLIIIKRRADLDVGDEYYYELRYPFLFRWEYWEALAGVDSSFYDITEPNNGLNNFWHRYDSLPFTLKAKVNLTVDNNSNSQTYENQQVIDSNDYDTNADWTGEYIKTFDGATELTSGGNKYLLNYKDVRVECFATRISAMVPANIEVVIWAETFESGGITGRTRISSLYDVDSYSWFKSTDTSNKVVLTIVGQDITAEALIDYSKMPAFDKFRIYFRIYDSAAAGDGLLLESGDNILLENGDNILLEG